MTTPVSITQKAVLTQLRTFILSLVTCEVVQGLGNGVAMPKGAFIAITPIKRARLSTNVDNYTSTTRDVLQATQQSVQIDCYGPLAGDWAQSISTLFRDRYACDIMGPSVQPLYNEDPMMIPLTTGENTYLERWMITAVLQYNPVVSVPQDFFDSATVEFINVPAEYPPE